MPRTRKSHPPSLKAKVAVEAITAPFVEKLAGPCGRLIIPELLKDFLEKVSTDGFQVIAKNIAEPKTLFAIAMPRKNVCPRISILPE